MPPSHVALQLLHSDQSAHIPSTIRMKEYMNTELNEKILSENNCGILFQYDRKTYICFLKICQSTSSFSHFDINALFQTTQYTITI
jgi:hypothetical protein